LNVTGLVSLVRGYHLQPDLAGQDAILLAVNHC